MHQRVQCEQCRQWLFVLPADPYPVPVAKPRRAKRGTKRTKTKTPADTVVTPVASPGAEPQPVAEPTASVTPLSQRSADGTQRAVMAVGRAISGWRTKLLTPFRLVMLGIVIVVVGTAFSVWNRARLEEAGRTWQIAREKGRAALKAGEIPTAVREFQRAVRALDILEWDDPPARMTRQLLRQVTAADQLLPVSLPEMIRSAEGTIIANPLGWNDRFEGTYKGRWLIMETSLVRVTEADDSDRVVIDCPLVIGTRSLEFTGASAAFGTLDINDVPRRVIFAAALRSCELSETSPDRWVIELDPQTAFLWTDFALLRRLGLAASDKKEEQRTRLLLVSQSRSIGIGGDQ